MPVLEHEREPWRQRQRAEMRCQKRNDAGLQGLPDERDRDACPCGREQSAEEHHRDTASTIRSFDVRLSAAQCGKCGYRATIQRNLKL